MLQVTMLLANAPGQPNGSVDERLLLNLELTPNGEIDQAAFEADPNPWIATRYTQDGHIRHGDLIRLDTGSWALRGEDGEDSPLWTIKARIFRPGEYASVRTQHDAELTYRIVGVQQAAKEGQGAAPTTEPWDPPAAEPAERRT
jgi:hypothetical protein